MVKIRKANANDVAKLISIGKRVDEFKVDKETRGWWSKKQLEKWIKSKSDVVLVAEEDKRIVGFVMFAHHTPTGKVTYENGWIDREYRGKEIILELTKIGLKKLKAKGARYICGLVKKDNINSIIFLEKNKFKKGFDFTWMHRTI